MQPLRLQIVSRALKRASIFLIFNDANGRYDLEKKGDAILMSKIVGGLAKGKQTEKADGKRAENRCNKEDVMRKT